MTDSIEEIKRKKMEELMKNQQEQAAEMEKKAILMKIVDSKGRERINNVKLTKPELAAQLEDHLIQLYKMNQIQPPVTEDQIIKIFGMLTPKRDFRITRK